MNYEKYPAKYHHQKKEVITLSLKDITDIIDINSSRSLSDRFPKLSNSALKIFMKIHINMVRNSHYITKCSLITNRFQSIDDSLSKFGI